MRCDGRDSCGRSWFLLHGSDARDLLLLLLLAGVLVRGQAAAGRGRLPAEVCV